MKQDLLRLKDTLQKAYQKNINLFEKPKNPLTNYQDKRLSSLQNFVKTSLKAIQNTNLSKYEIYAKKNQSLILEIQEKIKDLSLFVEQKKIDKSLEKLDLLITLYDQLEIPQEIRMNLRIPHVPEDIKEELHADLEELE